MKYRFILFEKNIFLDFLEATKYLVGYDQFCCEGKGYESSYSYLKVQNTHLSQIPVVEGEMNIPVGTVEDTLKFYEYHHDRLLLPINLDTLDIDLKRKVFRGEHSDIPMGWFHKEANLLKGEYTGIRDRWIPLPKDLREYIISEPLELLAEWRCFIHKGAWVGMQQYQGNFRLHPDIKQVEDLLKELNLTRSYALDIGVDEKGVVYLIEIHDFYSCGLYGYSENYILPMFVDSHKKIISYSTVL